MPVFRGALAQLTLVRQYQRSKVINCAWENLGRVDNFLKAPSISLNRANKFWWTRLTAVLFWPPAQQLAYETCRNEKSPSACRSKIRPNSKSSHYKLQLTFDLYLPICQIPAVESISTSAESNTRATSNHPAVIEFLSAPASINNCATSQWPL